MTELGGDGVSEELAQRLEQEHRGFLASHARQQRISIFWRLAEVLERLDRLENPQ